MQLQTNVMLGPKTTFGTGGPARYYVEATSREILEEALVFAREEAQMVLLIGGGSNIIFGDGGYPGMVVRIAWKGVEFFDLDAHTTRMTVQAGEVWDEVVGRAVEKGLWGLENLSAIPGLAGAAAVQNIGAYGQDVSQTIAGVTVLDRKEGEVRRLSNQDCAFGYRHSLFNSARPGRYVILETAFDLKKTGLPNTGYPDVSKFFEKLGVGDPSIAAMRTAITEIRAAKFADPQQVGTAGSFFKNMLISRDLFLKLRRRLKDNSPPALVGELDALGERFESEAGIKIPTAFLIDRVCLLKGTRVGGAMVSLSQALAIINPEHRATGRDVLRLIGLVRRRVFEKTGLIIELEPALIGFTIAELVEMKVT
ncbi:MAG TPA: UDP-N-acetylmuramate dehydrogenase [Calditrichia bacterium]|nr:UDP-N-acetylmuramate dehydrogenase [Calditrichota bacterium]HQU71182.1 UDP-N-acetylmuramate dehydrogenase [Calditrichia bacterium]HQV31305.1 UDP-N-acetylmuramate dehydrogenase [Calditrichia bacterium]